MGKSARILGQEFGRTAREMNVLLKDHGYLYGEPGAYGLTDKGKRYGDEQYHSRGTGGYAHYNPSWETRTWNDQTADALRADMVSEESAPILDTDLCRGTATLPVDKVNHLDPDDLRPRDVDHVDDDDDWEFDGKALLIAGLTIAVIVGAIFTARWLRNRRSKQDSDVTDQPDQNVELKQPRPKTL